MASAPRSPVNAYPLAWPDGVPRTTGRRRSPFFETFKAEGATRKAPRSLWPSYCELTHELRRLGAITPVISSNLRTKGDGTIWADQATSKIDPGVCVYWHMRQVRGGATVMVPHSMPCDTYLRVEDNLYDRFGAVRTAQVFAGFAALPPGDATTTPEPPKPWRDVIGGAYPDGLDAGELLVLVKSRFRKACETAHPDKGGSDELMAELNRAWDEAQAELGGQS